MIVKDVLKTVGLYLDLYDDFEPYFNDNEVSDEVKLEIEKILLAINSVSEELCFKVLPIKTKEVVTFDSNNSFDLSLLSKTLINISGVFEDKTKRKLKYNVFDNFLICNNAKTAEVVYYYLPNKVSSLTEQINIDNRLSTKAFVLGVISEYHYINGLFDDASVWQEKFLKAVKECISTKKSFNLPKRRWF